MLYVYPKKNMIAEAGRLYQWDYGQRLKISGVKLPESYIVHYSHSESGNAVSVNGDANGVNIPDDLLESGESINGWVFVQENETGKTEYRFRINVVKRPKPTEPRPEIIPAEGVEF